MTPPDHRPSESVPGTCLGCGNVWSCATVMHARHHAEVAESRGIQAVPRRPLHLITYAVRVIAPDDADDARIERALEAVEGLDKYLARYAERWSARDSRLADFSVEVAETDETDRARDPLLAAVKRFYAASEVKATTPEGIDAEHRAGGEALIDLFRVAGLVKEES